MLDLRVLQPGHPVDGLLAIRDKRGVAPYTGGFFYTLVVGDRHGDLVAKVWGSGDEGEVRAQHESLQVGDVVHVRGKATEYRGALELTLDGPPAPVPEEAWAVHDFLPRSLHDTRAQAREILAAARRIQEPHLRRLVCSFWEDPTLQPLLLEMPAARSQHHNWIGGFIEHLHGALRLADVIASSYPEIDRDLLVTGVLLHDIGKTREFRVGASIEFTDDGRLLGHVPLGDEMVRDAIARIPRFPEPLARKVRHMILSHHGRMEWGSAVEPRTPEAFVLHQLENMDAQVAKFLTACRKHRAAGEVEGWSSPLKQFVYLR